MFILAALQWGWMTLRAGAHLRLPLSRVIFSALGNCRAALPVFGPRQPWSRPPSQHRRPAPLGAGYPQAGDTPSMVPWAARGPPLLQGIQAAPSPRFEGPQEGAAATALLSSFPYSCRSQTCQVSSQNLSLQTV